MDKRDALPHAIDDNGSHFLTRDPRLTTTHESRVPTFAVSSQDHYVEVLSKSNIITATKYSVETTELN